MSRPCPCCSGVSRPVAMLHDDRFGEPGAFPLLACQDCGHHHLGGTAPLLEPGRLYEERYPRRETDPLAWRPAALRGGLAGWLAGESSAAWRYVPHRSRVLDIGAGLGEALGWHRSRGCDAHGTDTDPVLARIAAVHGLRVHIGNFAAAEWPDSSFDIITMDQVIEHMSDPIATLRGTARLLRPGGSLVISTPNAASFLRRLLGRRWVQWHAPYHLHLFSPRSLSAAVRSAGLRPLAHASRTPADWLLYQIRHLAEPAPRPGATSPWWKPGASRPLLGRSLGALAALCHRRLPGLHLLARALDAARRGDSQIIIAERPA